MAEVNLPRDPIRSAVARAMRDETNGAGAQQVNLADLVLSFAQQLGDFKDAAGRPVDFGLVSDGWAAHKAKADPAEASKWTDSDTLRLEMASAMTDCQRRVRAARLAYAASQAVKAAQAQAGLPEAPTEAQARGPLRLVDGDGDPLGAGE